MKHTGGITRQGLGDLSSRLTKLDLLVITGAAIALLTAGTTIYAALFVHRPSTPPAVQPKSRQSQTAATGATNSSSTASNNATSSGTNTGSTSGGVTPNQTIYPASILDLTSWKLTLPIAGNNGKSPQEILQPQLATYVLAPYFVPTAAKDGVQFQAQVGGVTTSGSNYPRSELREMTNNGRNEAGWSNADAPHTMTIHQAITHLPAVKSQLVAGQIHDANDYVILIRLEGNNLFVEAGGSNIGNLNSNYQLGTVFTLKIVAGYGHITVFYNDVQKVDYAKSGSGYYFKAGCYTQSNPSKGDSPSDYGQVIIYDLQLS